MDTSSWLRGNPVTIVQRWYRRDVLTGEVELADPTLTIFTVEAPDGTLTAYTFGVDGEITNPDVGVYLLSLAPPGDVGVYHWRAQASGAVVGANEGTFEILESYVLAGPSEGYGPCQPWIGASDVVNALGSSATDEDAWKYETAADVGSTLMWDLSGRQFGGVCELTLRPCSNGCSCFGASPAVGLGPWLWGGSLGGVGSWWSAECGDRCGCSVLDSIRLSGYPVREIVSVTIDGVVVDPDDYRLEERRSLVAKGSFRWPGCQHLELDDGPGTFFVRYKAGVDPPALGRLAAAELAAELFKAMNPGNGECKLAKNATRIVRQGVTVEKIATLAQVFKGGATGLALVDAFLASTNPTGMRRPPAVYSPDLRRGRLVR